MKINLALIASIVIAVGLVAFAFTAFQISSDRDQLHKELETRTIREAEVFYKTYLKDLEKKDSLNLNKITENVITIYSFTGIAVYYNADSIVPLTEETKPFIETSADYITQAVSADSSMGNNIKVKGKNLYEYIKVIKRKQFPESAVIFYTDADYIKNIINGIWLRNFIRWFLQALIISIVTLLIVRWGILSPLKQVIEWVKAARFGNVDQLKKQ